MGNGVEDEPLLDADDVTLGVSFVVDMCIGVTGDADDVGVADVVD